MDLISLSVEAAGNDVVRCDSLLLGGKGRKGKGPSRTCLFIGHFSSGVLCYDS